MLKHINKHIKGQAGNTDEYLCHFLGGQRFFLSMTLKEETTKEKMDRFEQLKIQNSNTIKHKSD